jgi:2-polyprenyl-6-methoxyphenol hydroxylase-like FAD-dependent oxidoreductase
MFRPATAREDGRVHAVISGAGIAGPALAHQLSARGWETTVLERFPQRRDEGQNVDIRGTARDVASRMGILDDVRAANTTEVGMRFVRADGSAAASFPVGDDGTDGPTAELEILRGELSRILIEHSSDRVDYRFGAQIADAVDNGDRVTVELQDGGSIDADLLVIAEGLNSRSRRLVTPVDVTELGMYIAYATIPRTAADDGWWNWQSAPGHRTVHLRPDNLGTTRAMLSFMSDVRGIEELDRAGLTTILRRTFDDVGGAAPRVLAAIEDGAPMYFSSVGQARPPVWSKGRITLLGDAAFCNGTFGGAGTSLALIGGYILAGELASSDDIRTALARYEDRMKPFVTTAPMMSASTLRRMNPGTRKGIRVLHGLAGLMAGPVGRAVTRLASRRTGEIAGADVSLPDYGLAAKR